MRHAILCSSVITNDFWPHPLGIYTKQWASSPLLSDDTFRSFSNIDQTVWSNAQRRVSPYSGFGNRAADPSNAKAENERFCVVYCAFILLLPLLPCRVIWTEISAKYLNNITLNSRGMELPPDIGTSIRFHFFENTNFALVFCFWLLSQFCRLKTEANDK